MEIITNNQPRWLISLAELPAKVQKDFDYIPEWATTCPRFVRYKGEWYDVDDVMAVREYDKPPVQGFEEWDGYAPDSFFSGVLFRYEGSNYTCDQVVVGRYMC